MERIAARRSMASFSPLLLHQGGGSPAGPASGVTEVPPDPDRELIVAALEEYPHGTRWFTELVTIHWDRVWTLSKAALLDDRAAENAAKLTFLRVHRRLDRYRFEQRFAAWMCGIARASIREALAQRPEPWGAGRVGRVGSWIVHETGRRIGVRGSGRSPHRAFAALASEDRQALALQCVEGLSQEEQAEALGIAPGRLESRREAARARLAQQLGPPAPPGAREGPDDRGRGVGVLAAHEAAAVRAALGKPDRERIVRAMDEIERQVALEDVVVMLVRSVVEATEEFFEVLGQLYPAGARPPASRS